MAGPLPRNDRTPLGDLTRVVAYMFATIFAFGVLVAGCTAVYDWRSDKVVASSRRASVHFDEVEAGMSEDRVERLLGRPSERYENGCWAWGDGWVFSASTVYTVCFEQGRVVGTSSASSDSFD
jgi:hypothetical protein